MIMGPTRDHKASNHVVQDQNKVNPGNISATSNNRMWF